MNLLLTQMLTDITGATGTQIIRAVGAVPVSSPGQAKAIPRGKHVDNGPAIGYSLAQVVAPLPNGAPEYGWRLFPRRVA